MLDARDADRLSEDLFNGSIDLKNSISCLFPTVFKRTSEFILWHPSYLSLTFFTKGFQATWSAQSLSIGQIVSSSAKFTIHLTYI